MSTPESPESPQLTRRQLRELRNTASTPIITPEEAAEAVDVAPVAAPLPRAAEPVVVADEPPAAADVDLDEPALTRRAARQQERVRTASVPVVDADEQETAERQDADEVDAASEVDATVVDAAPVEAAPVEADEPEEGTAEATTAEPDVALGEEVAEAQSEASETADDDDVDDEVVTDAPEYRPIVAPTFGSGLLAGEGVELELPASFDQLLTRGNAATGSLVASNALILSQTPETGSFSAPVAATGEVLITGMFNLPESFSSTGTSHGSSDGKEIDAILVDGELPAASSPTPIAASAAISTIKGTDDIIKPPAPEKGSRLMLALVITAGALALALTGALIIALVTGVFR